MVQRIYFYKYIIVIFIIFSPSFILGQTIEGKAKIVDGDTIKIGKNIIRLHGIDAPEKNQSCIINNEEWHCGKKATESLKNLINLKTIKCETSEKDRYNRYIAECYINNLSINQWMVRNGWAIAYRYYSNKFVDDEKIAKINQNGIWKGSFIEPYLFRKKNK